MDKSIKWHSLFFFFNLYTFARTSEICTCCCPRLAKHLSTCLTFRDALEYLSVCVNNWLHMLSEPRLLTATLQFVSSNLSICVYGNKCAKSDGTDKTCWKGLNLEDVPCQDWCPAVSNSMRPRECSSSGVVLCFSQKNWKKFQTLSPYTLICLAFIYTVIVDLLLGRGWCLEGLILYRKWTFGGVKYCVQLCVLQRADLESSCSVQTKPKPFTCLHFQGLAKSLVQKLFVLLWVQLILSSWPSAFSVLSHSDWCIQGNLSTQINPSWISILDFGWYCVI